MVSMGIRVRDFTQHAIEPALTLIGTTQEVNVPVATLLLAGIAAVETNVGEFLQTRHGLPQFGPYRMENRVFEDVISTYALREKGLARTLLQEWPRNKLTCTRMAGDLVLASFVEYLRLTRRGQTLPLQPTVEDLAQIWWTHRLKKADKKGPSDFIETWNRFRLGTRR